MKRNYNLVCGGRIIYSSMLTENEAKSKNKDLRNYWGRTGPYYISS